MTQHIAIAMSGGVDSALSAYLLLEQGYQVSAVFMRNWNEDSEHCQADIDASDAQMVCDKLGIPLHQVDFSKDYWDRVFSHCLDEFAASRTPNPDIWCNREIKFDRLLNYVLNELGADGMATGHYAQIKKNTNGECQLFQAIDNTKDQSYFLYTLNQNQLKHCQFPLGEMHKYQVRELAKKIGLTNHNKKDSTGICFIGERRFKTFLSQFLIAKPGQIHTEKGEHIGKHDGVMFYTIGQRQGLNIGGLSRYSDEAWYVIDKNIRQNILIVGQGKDHPRLFHQQLLADQIHWIPKNRPKQPLLCLAKIRYRQQNQACHMTIRNQQAVVKFNQQQRAITPGQSIVFYDNQGQCLGGGIIDGN
jgi:tRNA-specific 2-thiouridylase